MLSKLGTVTARVIQMISLTFLLAPIAVVTYIAFIPEIGSLIPKHGFTLEWFRFLNDPTFTSAVKVSVLLAAASATTSIVAGVLAGYALTRHISKGRGIVQSVFSMPLSTPGVVKGVSLLVLFSAIKLNNSFIELLIAHMIITLPYGLLAILPSYVTLDRSMEEAARSLGANELQAFLRVTLPLIRPGVLVAGVFAMAMSIDEVAASIFLYSPETTTLAILLFGWTRETAGNIFAAVSTLLIVITFAVITLLEKTVGLDRVVGGIRYA